MARTELLNAVRLPCGCVIGDIPIGVGEFDFGIRPCSLLCEYYLYTLGEARRTGKPIEPRRE
jgi:hypothetical protein